MSIKTICAGIGSLALIGGLAACGSAHPGAAPEATVTVTAPATAVPAAAAPAPSTAAPMPSATPSNTCFEGACNTGETPQGYLAEDLIGGADSTTGATVVSATVGAMCSSTRANPNYGDFVPAASPAYINYGETSIISAADEGEPDINTVATNCAEYTGIQSDAGWQSTGTVTYASGEVQMSDGNLYIIGIIVNQNQDISWITAPSS
jgi:hypothetical protein